MTTIQDVARVSGVSVTTVSHVLNHTRFVSPKLTRQVLDAVQELDYHVLRKKTGKTYFNTPNSIGLIVSRNLLMSSGLRSYVKMSYHSDWITIPSNREITVEKLLYIKKFYRCNKIIVHPSIDLINSNKRFFNDANIILVNQDKLPKESEAVELSLDYFTAAILALEYLTENNHSSIKIVASHLNSCCKKQIQSAADVFAKKNNIPMREDNTIFLEDGERYDVESAFKDNTAVVTVGLGALHAVINYSVMNHIEIPSELSLVSIDDDSFIENTYPEITSVDVNPDALSGMILSNPVDFSRTIANPLLKIRKSVTYLPVDPFGRAASRADVLTLTSTEKILIRKRCPVIGVSFFDAGTLYSEKVFSGIQEACANLSLKLLPVQDAKRNTDFEHQQLISLIHQGAEVLISVSNNHDNMVNAFTQIAHKFRIPLILGTHLPVNLFDYCYETCIATNEEEKGRQIAAFLAEEMGRKHQSKVLFMIDQNSSIGAENCASAALTTISAHYPNLEVASEIININSFRGSGTFRNVFSNCREIEGFYVQDATIACNLYQYLISSGREDVTIVTGQINNRLARHILLKNIESLGIVSSRPIEMGHWMAYAAASVILNKDVPRYVTVDPIVLDRENIEGLWQTLTQNKLV